MGTNKVVKITDAKSGLIRRLIDVSPSGNKLSPKEYKAIVSQIDFELGAIAYHCKNVYLANPGRYALYGTPKTSAYLPTVSQVMDLIEFHSTLRDSNGNAITDSSGNKMLSKVYE